MKQITLYYDPDSYRGKQTLALAQSNGVKIHDVDFTENPLTATQILKCVEECGLTAHDLVEEVKHYDVDFPLKEGGNEDWAKFLSQNPQLIKYPIAVKDKHYVVIKAPLDITRL